MVASYYSERVKEDKLSLSGDIPPFTEDEHHTNLPQKVTEFSLSAHIVTLVRQRLLTPGLNPRVRQDPWVRHPLAF